MSTTHYYKENDSLNKYLIQAIIFHLFIFFMVVFYQFLAGFEIFKNKNETKQIKIVQSSVRVDVVAMPKFTVQELKKMEITDSASKTTPEDVRPSEDQSQSEIEFKEQQKKVNLSSLLNNLSKKKNAKGKEKKEKSNSKLTKHRKQLRQLILEGNKVSEGAALVGDGLTQDKTVFNDYIASLPHLIRPYWKLPSYLMEKDLKCRIRIFIAANGKILRTQIFESSGVDEFDQRALAAVAQVAILPTPRKDILARVASGEVILGFPL